MPRLVLNALPDVFVWNQYMLDYAQRYTAAIAWDGLQQARQTLTATGAFEQGEYARLILP